MTGVQTCALPICTSKKYWYEYKYRVLVSVWILVPVSSIKSSTMYQNWYLYKVSVLASGISNITNTLHALRMRNTLHLLHDKTVCHCNWIIDIDQLIIDNWFKDIILVNDLSILFLQLLQTALIEIFHLSLTALVLSRMHACMHAAKINCQLQISINRYR